MNPTKTDASTVNLATLGEKVKALGQALQAATVASREATAALPRSTSLGALAALNMTGKHIYAGTADPVTVAKNRKANKAARAQRRVNRKRNFRKGVR